MYRIFNIIKILKLYIPGIIFVSILSACEEKNVDYGLDVYYVEIATAQSSNEFLPDNGKTIVAAQDENAKTYAFGDRVLLNYTLLSSTASGDGDSVRINGSAKIPLGKIMLKSDSAIRSESKEPILLESVWLGSRYLNMQFYFNYMSEKHTMGLLADSARLKGDTLRLYFVHNTNNDPPGYPAHSYLSFDLKDVLGEPGKARPISVQINTDNYGIKTYGFEY